jgi:8-amino-7-oxononanoate synthase
VNSLNKFLFTKLEKRKQLNSFRALPKESTCIDFCSNDYLGLARSESLYNLIHETLAKLPHRNGATGSRLISGNSNYTEVLEHKLSGIFKSKSCLLFNSGYTANLAVLSSIPQKDDTIFYDELAHACIKDGARLSLATRHPFKHNDLNDLEAKLKRAKGNIFIAVESIYSMDGDECPLEELCSLAESYYASIILDEAHSTGLFTPSGSGLAVHKKVHSKIPIRIFTFGKAMGVHGACVAGSTELTQYLINFARPFIYTTAMPIHSLTSIACALDFIQNNPQLQHTLTNNIQFYQSCINSIPNTNQTQSNSAIQTILITGNTRVKEVANALQEKGFDTKAILPPTVKENSERIRICLHSFNSNSEIDGLLQTLREVTG